MSQNDIAQNIHRLRTELPQSVKLVAVSKFHPVEAIQAAYNAGQRIFGESRVAELNAKIDALPSDVQWHFIGHLQTNKVKSVIGRVSLIESIDSQRLLDLVDSLSEKAGVITRVLMQVHIAAEDTKFGWTPGELMDYFRERRFKNLKATHLCGLMGMATNTDNTERIEADFATLGRLHRQILEITPDLRGFDEISMGMSDDYRIAIRHGSTMVRIGSDIFGVRQY